MGKLNGVVVNFIKVNLTKKEIIVIDVTKAQCPCCKQQSNTVFIQVFTVSCKYYSKENGYPSKLITQTEK